MRFNRFVSAAMVAASLSLASAASAEHRTFAFSITTVPSRGAMWSVQSLAHELEAAAARVHRDAEAQAHHFTRPERVALIRLHRLEDAAASFHAQVETSYQTPGRTRGSLRDLVRTYNIAARSMEGLHAYGNVYGEFARVSDLMERLLDRYADTRPYRYGQADYRSNGAYDRYGDGRHERWDDGDRANDGDRWSDDRRDDDHGRYDPDHDRNDH